jgi:hypothetical protein
MVFKAIRISIKIVQQQEEIANNTNAIVSFDLIIGY